MSHYSSGHRMYFQMQPCISTWISGCDGHDSELRIYYNDIIDPTPVRTQCFRSSFQPPDSFFEDSFVGEDYSQDPERDLEESTWARP